MLEFAEFLLLALISMLKNLNKTGEVKEWQSQEDVGNGTHEKDKNDNQDLFTGTYGIYPTYTVPGVQQIQVNSKPEKT